MPIYVFYVWRSDNECGDGICKKEGFISSYIVEHGDYYDKISREIIFEFSTYDEFIQKFNEYNASNNDGSMDELDYYLHLIDELINK